MGPPSSRTIADFRRAGANIADERAVVETAAPGIDAERGDLLQLFAAGRFEAIGVFAAGRAESEFESCVMNAM